MGEVYRATDSKLRREVAIKVLPAAFTEDSERLARFEREAQLLAQLHHPNIASIFGLEEAGGVRALVMELVEGQTLAQRLESGSLPLEESLAIARQIAEALEEAHEKGIIHRDLKPQNIKASMDGRVKVLDFGLAKALDPAAGGAASGSQLAKSPTLTMGATVQGVILGTAAYMSPEQAKGLAVDKRADIWAFGVVLYEMLSGRRLFEAPTVPETLVQVLTRAPDLGALPASTPATIRRLLRHCLERNPKNRLRDIGDARLALEEALAGEKDGKAPPAAVGVPRPNRLTVVMAAVAVCFALLFLASVVRRRDASAPERGVVRFPLATDPSLFVYTELTTPFTLSPDGETIVFVAANDGPQIHLWARTLDDPRARRLDDTEGAVQPAVSPDGEWIAFIVRSNQIRKVRLRGGAATQLATIGSVSASLTWASNDELLFEVLGEEAGIHRVSATGGVPTELIPLDRAAGETTQRRPFVLRRERMVLYASTTTDGRTTLAIYSLADGRRARLEIEGIQALGMVDDRLVYSRSDGNLMAVPLDVRQMRVTGTAIELPERVEVWAGGTKVALSENGTLVYRAGSTTSRLVLVDSQGRSEPLGTEVGAFREPRFSPDGRRIAVGLGSGGAGGSGAVQDLWLFDRESGEATRLTRTGSASMPEWAPDGSRLVYISRAPPQPGEIWTLPLDGSAEASRLVEVEGDVIHAVMAPDGRFLIAVRKGSGISNQELIRVPLDGSAAVTPLVAGSSRGAIRRPTLPRVSPDGRKVAFADGATWEVYVRPLDGAGTLQVTDNGGWSPAWGADSRHLFFGNGNLLVVAELRAGPSLAVAERRIVAQLNHLAEEFDLSPDGQTFVVAAPASGGSDVLVAVNWSDDLRRTWRQLARGESAP